MAFSLRLPPEMEADLKRLAGTHSRSMHGEMLHALKQYVQRENERGFLMDKKLVDMAQQAISQCREEGVDEDDVKWMATGAIIREGRHQGVIDDVLSPEMEAAILALVKQEMKAGSI